MLHFQRWKLILVFGIVVAGILFALPNMFPAATMARMPAWLPHKQVNLGLDLQGGAHLLYQLDEKEMVDDWLNTVRGDVRETLRRTHIGYTDLSQDVATRSVSVKIRDAAEMDKADTELKKLAQPVGGSVFAGFSGYDIDVARQGDDAVTLTLTDVGMTHRLGSGHSGFDRDHQAARRCLRHHRAQHPARRPQPYSRPGPRHSRRRAPEDADRQDRQARIQAGRPLCQRSANCREQAGSSRR